MGAEVTPQQAAAQQWDVIVIGAGMGGGMAGRRLAERGLNVLFVEKGPAGFRTEAQTLADDIADPAARQMRGFWPTPVEARIDGEVNRFFGPYGAGVGGSSTFYAAALERPEPHDLDDRSGLPHPTGGWPVGYDAFRPYFDQAEAALEISGTPDPLSDIPCPELKDPPPLTDADAAMIASFEARGLTPYRAHNALRALPGCAACFGRKCPRPCKMDGRSAGVEPALATGRAHLLTGCEVEELIEEGNRVTGLRARTGDGEIRLRAAEYVLAGGALHSPRLLLASRGRCAEGAANSSGLVGRGLMFHLHELIAVWPHGAAGRGADVGATRAVAFRDFYTVDGKRLGIVQAMGLAAEYGTIAAYLHGQYDRSPFRRWRTPRKFLPVVAMVSARLFGKAAMFSAQMEDLAYPENRVVLNAADPEIPTFEYRISPELRARRALFRRKIRRALGWRHTMFLCLRPELNYGHPSGTLRFGTDPATSVLDADCRSHDLANLSVADASFMPTSMGVNPSLMIAANALRVADRVAMRHNGAESAA